MLGVITKADDDQLDYDVDYSEWLDAGDTVQSAVVTADPGLFVDTVHVATPIVKVWLSGGEAGSTYELNVLATTAQSRVKEVCFKVRVTAC